MTKLTFTRQQGWPVMNPLGKKEAELLKSNLTPGEVVLGQVIANFGQAVVATDQKVIVVKHGWMAGQTLGSKATSFDYHYIGAVEVRTGWAQGEMEIINPSMPSSQGNRIKDKVAIQETPNGVVFPKANAKLFNEFAAKVREMVAKAHIPVHAAAPPPAAASAIPEQIRQLSELHAVGVLTDEEFSTKKADLLLRM
jgi:hypothetical protein